MSRLTMIALSAGLVAANSAMSKALAQTPPPPTPVLSAAASSGRPGIAVELSPEGDGVGVKVALDWLVGPTAQPKFLGSRFYKYSVPLGTTPTRVGWRETAPNTHPTQPAKTVVLHNRAYLYTEAMTDRFENGAMTVEKVENRPDKYRIQGVYSYFSQLFVLDEIVTINQPVLLYSPPP